MYKQTKWGFLLLLLTIFVSCNIFQRGKSPTEITSKETGQQTQPVEVPNNPTPESEANPSQNATQTAQTKSSQTEDFIPTPQRADNLVVQEMAQKIFGVRHNKDVTIHLKDDFEFTPETFFEDYKEAFGLGEHDEMRLVEIIGEERRLTLGHNILLKGYNFQQYHKDIPISNHSYQIIYRERGPIKVSGNILENLDVDVTPNLSEQEALQIVMDSLKADSYCWLNRDCPTPKADLKILIDNNETKLIYDFLDFRVKKDPSASSKNPPIKTRVNAHTGEIILLGSNVAKACVSYPITTQHYEDYTPYTALSSKKIAKFQEENSTSFKSYVTCSDCPSNLYCPGEWISVKSEANWATNNDYMSGVYTSNNSNWSGLQAEETKAISALFAVEYAWQWLQDNLSVHGPNKIRVEIEATNGDSGSFAKTNDEIGTISLGEDYSYPGFPMILNPPFPFSMFNTNSLDLIGHELAHGIDHFNRNGNVLVDIGNTIETQTIAESISDMFGALIEMDFERTDSNTDFNTYIDDYSWIMFDEIHSSVTGQRSFADPNSYGYSWKMGSTGYVAQLGQPDYYLQPDRFLPVGESDKYVNIGVTNHWFYLLLHGGENKVWIDENSDGEINGSETNIDYSVAPISYKNMVDLLNSILLSTDSDNSLEISDGFQDFGEKALNSALALFSDQPAVICSVKNALDATNLPYPNDIIPANLLAFDLSMKDCEGDLGSEPSTECDGLWGTDMWNSPAIVNCYRPPVPLPDNNPDDGFTPVDENNIPSDEWTCDTDIHQLDEPVFQLFNPGGGAPFLQYPNRMILTVHNIGCTSYDETQGAVVKPYWTFARTDEVWPDHWEGDFEIGIGGDILVLGNQLQHHENNEFPDVNTFTTVQDFLNSNLVENEIPDIPAGGEYEIEFPWHPPQFTPSMIANFGIESEDGVNPEFCFLARIESTVDPMVNEQLGSSIGHNVYNNNNIATKNVVLMTEQTTMPGKSMAINIPAPYEHPPTNYATHYPPSPQVNP